MKTFSITMIIWSIALFLMAGVCRAEDNATDSLPFELKCPNALQCEVGEQGYWVPSWYVRSTAADLTLLEGTKLQLEQANQEILTLRDLSKDRASIIEETKILLAAHEKQVLEAAKAVEKANRKSERRIKAVIGTTIVATVLASILTVVAISN